MTSPFDLDAVLGELTGRSAAERKAEQAEIGGALRALGISPDPGLGAGVYVAGMGPGLLVPTDSRPAPIDYIGVYTTLSYYYAAEGLGLSPSDIAEGVIRIFCAQAPRDRLIELLVTLNRGMGYPELLDAFLEEHRRSLRPDAAARFDNALKAEHKVPVAPQVVLAALRHVLAMDEIDVVDTVPPESLVMTFVHAIAEGLAANASADEEKMADLPITLAMDMVRNAIFNEHDDTYSGIARQLRLWRDYANTDAALVDGRHPAELARNAIGIEVEDFLALGFALMSHAMAWRPGQPLYMSERSFPNLDPAVFERFLAVVAMSPKQMQDALRSPRSQWDFLLLQQRPVLRMPGGLLVIDVGLLFERVTTGLFWDVHDHLKTSEGEHSREQWTWAWGAIVEAMIEDELSTLAPALLDGTKFVWDEDDLQQAYGQRSKRADQVIDAGRALGAWVRTASR